MAKLRLQSSDADGYVAAQSQALKLQSMLLEHLRQPGNLGAGEVAAEFDRDSVSAAGSKSKEASVLAMDGMANGVPAAAAAVTSSGKAANMCFDLAEFHRQRHQLDKVWR